MALRQLARDASMPAILAGIIATLVSFAGPLVIIFQAASGLPPAQLASWVWAIAMGSGVLGVALSLRYRVPVVVAWSIPGSVLLVSLLPTVDFAVAVGAYLVASAVILLVGLSGLFDRLVAKLPAAIPAAMLAGILFGFATELFVGMKAQPLLVLAMFAGFFVGRRLFPRYAVVLVLLIGIVIALGSGQVRGQLPALQLTAPVWVMPRFDWQAVLNIALPLVVVAITGQFMPGIALLRSSGYHTPAAGPLVAWSAAGSALLAPFGCHGLNLAAVTAALCTGPEAHDDPARRYVAGVSGGVLYLLLGLFAGAVLALFATLPKELIATLAGLALFPTIASALSGAVADPGDRDAALVTFIVSASGMSLFGLGAAFWSLLLGMAAHLLLRHRRATSSSTTAPAQETPMPCSNTPSRDQGSTP